MNFGSHDSSTAFQGEYVSNDGLALSMDFYDVGYLNYGVLVWSRKSSFLGGTFDIKRHDSQWRNFGQHRKRDTLDIMKVKDIELKLAG